MAVVITEVETKGNLGRVYDVTMAAGDATATIPHGLKNCTPELVLFTPNGANAVGCYTDQLRLTSIDDEEVVLTKATTVAASFRVFIGRSYVTNAN